MKYTVMLIAAPQKVNLILVELAAVEVEDITLQPIWIEALVAQDVMITYRVDAESEEARFAHLSWMEETIGQPMCKVY